MKLDVYYAAYGQREYMGNINDSDGRIVFRYDEDFLHRRVPVYPNKWFGDELISDDVKLPPALFWDFLPTGYNAEMLYKISNSSVFQIPVLKKLAMCSKKTIGAIEFEPALPVRLEEKQVDLDLIEEDIVREQNLGKLYRLLASINGHTPKITVDVSENSEITDCSYARGRATHIWV